MNPTTTQSITNKQNKIQQEINASKSKIGLFNILSWVLLLIGIALLGWGLVTYFNNSNPLGINILGIAPSIWALSGIFFIYRAFFKQKEQLLEQQLDFANGQLAITNIKEDVAQQRMALTAQQEHLVKTQEEFTTQKTNLQKCSEDLKGVQTKLVAQKSELTRQSTVLETAQAELTNQTGALEAQVRTTQADAVKQKVALEKDIKANQTNLMEQRTVLKDNIKVSTASIEHNNIIIKAMKSEFAEQKVSLESQIELLKKTQLNIEKQKMELEKLALHIKSLQKTSNKHEMELNRQNSTLTSAKMELVGQLEQHSKNLQVAQLELQEQKVELENHNTTWSHQKFDNTFFNFLENHNNIVTGLELYTSGSTRVLLTQGKDSFPFLHKKLGKKVAESSEYTIENVLGSYSLFFKTYQKELERYFTNIYEAVKFVDESQIKENNKQRYANFVRAQLSTHELALIFYHALSVKAPKDFKKLINKYELFKNIDNKLLFGKTHLEQYEKTAFLKK